MWLTFSKSSQTFSVDLFNNYFGLQRYMSAEKELKEIKALSEKPQLLRRPSMTNAYFGSWTVIWICLKFPIDLAVSSACSAVALVLNTIWLKHYAAFFEVASIQMTRRWQQVSDQWTIKSPMLVPALNAPKMSAWDVYTCPDFPMRSVSDPDVKSFTYKEAHLNEQMDRAINKFYKKLDKRRDNQYFFIRWSQKVANLFFFSRTMERSSFKAAFTSDPQQAMKKLKDTYRFDPIAKPIAKLYQTLLAIHQSVGGLNKIQLYNSRGGCRGATDLFIHLLFKSEHYFNDPVKHIQAVAKQFETGIPGQGLVLQALVNTSRLLDQRVTKMHNHTVSTFELDADHSSALKKIQTLPTGIYRVGVYQHSLLHFKLPNGESYTWDPECGLYEQTSQQLLDFVLKHNYAKENPQSHIYFEKHHPVKTKQQSA